MGPCVDFESAPSWGRDTGTRVPNSLANRAVSMLNRLARCWHHIAVRIERDHRSRTEAMTND
jgi:hypothetical protein